MLGDNARLLVGEDWRTARTWLGGAVGVGVRRSHRLP
jgi:hypothetical protein